MPSRYKRDALCVNIAAPAAPGKVLRLLNVHLDSLDSHFRRALQMMILAGLLREPGCSGGIIAGDFNALTPADHALVDNNKLVDAWVALHGSTTVPDGGVSTSTSRTDRSRADWTRSLCWACSLTRSKSFGLVSSTLIRAGATIAGYAAPLLSDTVSNSFCLLPRSMRIQCLFAALALATVVYILKPCCKPDTIRFSSRQARLQRTMHFRFIRTKIPRVPRLQC